MVAGREQGSSGNATSVASCEPLRIGVLGDAGVGKTTLLNALVGEERTILPAGGVGPVTGRATRLYHAQAPCLSLKYLPPQHAYELCYAVEHLDAAGGGRRVRESDYRERLSESQREAARAMATSASRGLLAKDARLLVVGDPDSSEPLERVRGGLRVLLDLAVAAGEPAADADPFVLFRCRQVLRAGAQGLKTEQLLDLADEASRERLDAHVAGPLSVLTEEVGVGWPSNLLASGLELVDLPGVGVAFDAHQRVTRRWLRGARYNGLVFVCSRGGISSSCEGALIESEALAALVATWSQKRPSIVVAVTKLDDEAQQLRRQQRDRSTRAQFADLGQAMTGVIRTQLFGTLRRALTTVPEAILHAIANATPVIPVAAPDYLLLHGNDPELTPVISSISETNLPRLSAVLRTLAAERHRVTGTSEVDLEPRLASRSPR